MKGFLKHHRNDQRGQAVVEYMLMLAAAIGFVVVMQSGFRGSIILLWNAFARDIAAACPTNCPPPANVP